MIVGTFLLIVVLIMGGVLGGAWALGAFDRPVCHRTEQRPVRWHQGPVIIAEVCVE